ncbi:MAG: serine protease [Acidobacteriota bacterium]|nr:serine protease [Acidobacteriota bacterium]
MRPIWFIAIAFSHFTASVIHAQTSQAPHEKSFSFSAQRAAVVHVAMTLDSGNPDAKVNSGTGFLISKSGYALTAKHIVSAYKNSMTTPIKVRIGSLDGLEVEADPIELGVGLDVMLLKLRDPRSLGINGYSFAGRGDASQIAIGDPLFIVGFNFSSNISLAQGTLGTNFGGGEGGNTLWSVNAIGAMFGMSGAPVFSSRGAVIGILEGGQPGTGIVQILPEDLLEPFAAIPRWNKLPITVADTTGVLQNRNVSTNQINMSCDQTVNVQTPALYFGRHPRDVQVSVAWEGTDNLKTHVQSTEEIKDPQTHVTIGVRGIGTATGLDSQSLFGIKNCPGGGHGELILHATWKEDAH